MLALALSSCASIGGRGRAELELAHDATITAAGETPQARKKGDRVEVGDSPMFIEAPGKVGVVILPMGKSPAQIKLSLRPAESWGAASTDRHVSVMLEELVAQISEAQLLLASRKASQALAKLEALQTLHPSIEYLKFLRASCLVVLGERDRALTLLDEALASHPNDRRGQALKRALTERSPSSARREKSR